MIKRITIRKHRGGAGFELPHAWAIRTPAPDVDGSATEPDARADAEQAMINALLEMGAARGGLR